MRVTSLLLAIVGLALFAALPGIPRSFAEELPWLISPPSAPAAPAAPGVPAWLQAHVGEGDGQISAVVLQRARGFYLQKAREGAVNNPCYFAFDATRPADGRRFYAICEANKTFRAVPSGHGSGRNSKRHRGFLERPALRQELLQCGRFQADDRRRAM